jgi:adenylate kinase
MRMVFLGPPGAGKGTLAAMASKRMVLPHISTGDLFRAAIGDGSDLGKKVKGILAEGKLVSDELTIELVKGRLADKDALAGWILDGFPRTVQQAQALEGFDPVDIVVNFDVDDTLILSRLTGRIVCKACGKIYHATTMPPAKAGLCDACGGTLYTRPDDTKDAIWTRLSAYRQQTAPLIEWYGSRGKLVTIDGAGTPEEVYVRFAEAVGR